MSRLLCSKNPGWRSLALLWMISTLWFISAPALQAAEGNLQFVFHSSVAHSSLSPAEARAIFSARQQYWDDGTKIHVFVLQTDSPLHQQFCRQMLQMFPYQLERIWNQITYSGQGDPPHIMQSEQALLEAVRQTPGAVGYVQRQTLSSQQTGGETQ